MNERAPRPESTQDVRIIQTQKGKGVTHELRKWPT